MPNKYDFRDVSSSLRTIREFLLGRKFVFHHRFAPVISPRSIPPPDVPRGPEYKYSNQYYGNRDLLNSVKPPVVAPIAEGFKSGAKGKRSCSSSPQKSGTGQNLKFPSELPTPGCVWWFDAHCYYKEVQTQAPCGVSPPVPCPPRPASPCTRPTTSPCPCPPPQDEYPEEIVDPCAADKKPPCKLDPCKKDPPPPPPPPEICDPCREEDPKKKC